MVKLSLICLCLISGCLFAQEKKTGVQKTIDFSLIEFVTPNTGFGPMTRWWWPGNLVDKTELKREIGLFADNGFAGVEIQPLDRRIPVKNKEEEARKLSWDSPEYYENLITVMKEARRRHLVVDVTNGSGWPPGGSFLSPEDGFLSLEFTASIVTGGKSLVVPLGKPANPTKVSPQLVAVLIAKTNGAKTSDETVNLDPAKTIVVTSYVKNEDLYYDFPEGEWRMIAFWAVRTGERTEMVASPQQGPVLNHFDSLSVLKFYDHLYGARTGLKPYFGDPMRAIFSDSYEFSANRFYAFDLPAYFLSRRGYDLTPWLPANMQKGYNTVIFSRPPAQPDFSFGNEDWRLRYDYDRTLNELLRNHFLGTSRKWATQRGLLFRTQAYGFNMDMIAMAGEASIPETESMLGAEANLKIMSSGALLYNRPVISAEAAVFGGMAYTNTPQKLRLAVDKLFAAGVNQVIYHGIPYKYVSKSFGPENWYLFSSPLGPHINFSSNLGEGNVFWEDQKRINAYVSRVQYAMRSGKPKADILIYFPFMNIEGMPDNPEEILTTGHMREADGKKPLLKHWEIPDPEKIRWAEKVYPLINRIEAAGLSWSWVNDESIQAAKLQKNHKINIRGNVFEALVLANDSVIELASAQKINLLSAQGMCLLVTGDRPRKQPSYLNWQLNDALTRKYIETALHGIAALYTNSEKTMQAWISRIPRSLTFEKPYSFLRQADRKMLNGSHLKFIWNKSNEWQTITLNVDKKFAEHCWLDPATGSVFTGSAHTATYQLAPYGSVLLFASTKQVSTSKLTKMKPTINLNRSELVIQDWNLQVGSYRVDHTRLFDWRDNDSLKYSADKGLYKASFRWKKKRSAHPYYLDLGKVGYTAQVWMNGHYAGKNIYSPYLFEISKFLTDGLNQVQVRVTQGQLNGFIGKGISGDGRYLQFKDKQDQLMSGGLLGPVQIRTVAIKKKSL